MKILFALSCIGLIISAPAHFSTYFGIDPSEPFPHIWLMHIGAFGIFIPCLFIMFTVFPIDKKGRPQLGAGAAKWIRWVTGAAGVLAIGSFALFIVVMLFWGSGAIRNGQYVQENIHGQVVRQITEAEYHQYNASAIRMFSSFWLFFFSLDTTILASAIAYQKLGETSGLATTEQGDGDRCVSLWVHELLTFAVLGIGFVTGPLIVFATTIVFHLKFGLIATVLFFPSAIPGFLVARRLVEDKVPEMCPKCGGRVIFVGRRGIRYRCEDCEWKD